MSQIKIKDKDITNIYFEDKPIVGIYLCHSSNHIETIYEDMYGELQSTTNDREIIKYHLKEGVLTFDGAGTIPVIKNFPRPQEGEDRRTSDEKAINELWDRREEVVEIIIEDTITEILEGALGCFCNLQKITVPFIGGNIKSKTYSQGFWYIFRHSNTIYEDEDITYGNDDILTAKYYQVNFGSCYTGSNYYRYTPRSTSLYYMPKSLTTVIAKKGQYNGTGLYANSFDSCLGLEDVTVLNVSFIQTGCFYNCRSLKRVALPFIRYLNDTLGGIWWWYYFNTTNFFDIFGRADDGWANPDASSFTKVYTRGFYGSSSRPNENLNNESWYSRTSVNYVPKTLKEISMLNNNQIMYWNSFDYSYRGNYSWEGGSYQSGDFVLQKLKFIGNNPYICRNNFNALGKNKPGYIYLPEDFLIGQQDISANKNNLYIYYAGNKNQWENLKSKNSKTTSFFNNIKNENIHYNATIEEFDNLPITE